MWHVDWRNLAHTLPYPAPFPPPLTTLLSSETYQLIHYYLTLSSQVFNAKQLTKCCLHFIAFNFKYFQGIGKELHSVVKENKEFFEEHRWPPLEYVQALEKYKHSTLRKRLHVRRKSVSCLSRRCSVM